jgi:excisionase family DNA binding protein
VSGLARALLDELEHDPVALARFRALAGAPQAVQADPPELMTLTQAGRLLGVSAKTVGRRIAEGALPAVVDHGRRKVRREDLDAYLRALRRSGATPVRRRRPRAPSGRFDFLRDP